MTSPKGKRLTERHLVAQAQIGDQAAERVGKAWDLIDVDDLDGTFNRFAAEATKVAIGGFAESERVAARYLPQFGDAEGVPNLTVPPPRGLDTDQFLHDLLMYGPVSVKKKIGEGWAPFLARQETVGRLLEMVSNTVQMGGRNLIIGASKYRGKSGRWRRVASGPKPCAFCGMLAGRGPVYREETVTFEAHPGCHCGAELVLSEWEPTDAEAQWRLAYDVAAVDADEAGGGRWAPSRVSNGTDRDTILWRMRRVAPHLFSDGVYPKV